MSKHRKKIYFGIFFVIFLCFGFFYLSANKISASDLEVQYPTISIGGKSADVGTDLPTFARYLFFLGMAVGFFSVFLSLIIAGAMYLISPANLSADLVSRARDRVSGAISGLLILALIYLIITTINPQLSIFSINQVPKLPTMGCDTGQCVANGTEGPCKSDTDCKPDGVYFYDKAGCPDKPVHPPDNVISVPDLGNLGNLRNQVKSVGIVGKFVVIEYDKPQLQGKCQYLDPNQNCQTGADFANSASIYAYNPSPNGDGVYFYRKSFFNGDGGYFEVQNSDIKGLYEHDLNTLQFIGCGQPDPPKTPCISNSSLQCSGGDCPICTVPWNERDCQKYDKNGDCDVSGMVCPYLSGENISSVKINGDYIPLFVYKASGDNPKDGPWTSCETFPTNADINDIGPQQLKWETIRNQKGVVPNYIVIIPVQEKSNF